MTASSEKVMSSELKARLRMGPVTREGEDFRAGTIANYLVSREFVLPSEVLGDEAKVTVLCIDDGIETINAKQVLIPISGSGLGEDHGLIGRILPRDVKIKPHKLCGKATMVLERERRELGIEPPTAEDVDEYARAGAEMLALTLGRRNGRMITDENGEPHKTVLERPLDFHPGDGALMALSGMFLHNLMPVEDKRKTPAQFKLAGHYLGDPSLSDVSDRLQNLAAGEILLADQIASGVHGVGEVRRGFRVTALIDEGDQLFVQKIDALKGVWHRANLMRERLVNEGVVVNRLFCDVVSYAIDQERGRVAFKQVLEMNG